MEAGIEIGELNFEILDSVKPSVNGKDKYQRLLIKRIPSTGEKVISVCKICEDYMAEHGKKKDFNECEKCELEFVVLEPEGEA
jgi:hypothetical protein